MKEVNGTAAAFTVFASWASGVPKLCLSALQKKQNNNNQKKGKNDKLKRDRVRQTWLSNSAAQLDFSRLALRDPVKQSLQETRFR